MEERFLEIAAAVLRVKRENLNMDVRRDELESWDSLAHIALIAELEEEIGVEIPIEDVPNIKALKDFKKYLE